MKSWILGGAALAALSGHAVQAQPTHSLADDAAAFGARPAVIAPRLSPEGTRVLYLTPGPGPRTYAVVSDLSSGNTSVVTTSDGNPENLGWCNFSSADRIVCDVEANVPRVGDLLWFQRLLAMNIDGTDAKLLGQPRSYYDAGIRQYGGDILDWNGASDGTVLMQREYVPEAGKIGSNIIRKKQGLGVDRVDTRTLRSTVVEPPNDAADNYMTDGRGNVRIMKAVEAQHNGALTGRVKYFYHPSGSRSWKTLSEYSDSLDQIRPLAIDAAIDSVYVLRKRNGRKALYRIKLDESLAETLVADNPNVDISSVIRSGDGQRVIGYTYYDETNHTVYFDPEFKSLAGSLSRALPNLPIVDFVDASTDGRKLLIYAGSDTDPGRYYLFDRDTKHLNEAMLVQPKLEGRTLAQVKPVSIAVAGGVTIPGYLTLPVGKDPKNLPAVIMPHGGPESRDYWGFDPLSQFLAARGYAVLQPEYRGSAGYGDTWQNQNAFRNWRTAMSDIAGSARWLAAQGIADPNRMAIFGWSYGGYAALMEAETDPSLYKAVIAVAPVTDLELLKRDEANFTDSRLVEQYIGSGAHIDEGSPLRHAGAIQAPVLLAHGDLDSNVRFWHSEKMAAALKSAGKDVEFLEFKGLDHQLSDSAALARLFNEMGRLLERTIGH